MPSARNSATRSSTNVRRCWSPVPCGITQNVRGRTFATRPSWTFRSRPTTVRQSDSSSTGWARATGSAASQVTESTSVVRNARTVAERRSAVTQPISPTSSPGPMRPARTSWPSLVRTYTPSRPFTVMYIVPEGSPWENKVAPPGIVIQTATSARERMHASSAVGNASDLRIRTAIWSWMLSKSDIGNQHAPAAELQ